MGVTLDLACVYCKIRQKETVKVTRYQTSQCKRRDDHKNENFCKTLHNKKYELKYQSLL